VKVRHIDWYADEWLAGTYELSNDERGLYITACSLIYSTGGPITRDRLKAACKDHGRAFNRQLEALIQSGKLTVNGREISQKRCENELERAGNRHGKARENGEKGGRPPKENKDIEKADGSSPEKLRARSTNYQPPTNQPEDAADAASGAQEAANGRKRGSRLAADWQPSSADWDFAVSLGLDAERVAAEFRDHWIAIPGTKGCKLDWSATFRNRCRQIDDYRRSRGQGGPGSGGSGHSRIAAALDRVHVATDVSGPH
jgi:uncharacterized protein YdaU (DUF1376 family)